MHHTLRHCPLYRPTPVKSPTFYEPVLDMCSAAMRMRGMTILVRCMGGGRSGLYGGAECGEVWAEYPGRMVILALRAELGKIRGRSWNQSSYVTLTVE